MAGEPALTEAWVPDRPTVDFEAVFRILGFPLALLQVQGADVRFVGLNETFSRMTGLIEAGVGERPLQAVLPAEAAIALSAGAIQATQRKKPVRVDVALARRGLPHDVILSPLVTARGEALVVVDAERRRATRLPGERGHTLAFDRLARVNEGLIYIYDLAGGRTTYVARRLGEMLGQKGADPVRFADVRALVHVEDRPALDAHVRKLQTLDDWAVASTAFRVPAAEGDWRWIEIRARALSRDRQGRVRRVLGVATDVTDRRSMVEALDAASRALLNAAESERRRVGRELHDSTAQHLVAIDLGLSALERRLTERGFEDGALFADIRTSLKSAHREIRAFSYLLHPPLLKRRGLAETLRKFVEGFARRAPLEFDLRLPRRAAALPEDVEIALFRVAQEALMNVYRHADASRVRVELSVTKAAYLLEVEDDGVGITDAPPGVGITGMKARLAQLGGSLTLKGMLVGTRLRARIPRGSPRG